MDVLKELHKKHKIANIGFNVDYSPYAKKRDEAIKKWAKNENITVYSEEDMLLKEVLEGETKSRNSGEPYKVFTPYMKFLRKTYDVKKPTKKTPKVSKKQLKQNIQ